jgi:putative transcriptional regulator
MLSVESLRGNLLVAGPELLDPNFHRSVVLIADHGEEGAMGVVLNRRSEHTVEEAVPDLGELVDPGEHVHVGGPVQPTGVVVLAEFDDPSEAAATVLGDVGFVAAGSDMDGLPAITRRARVFAGIAGWGPGQLESELEEEAWFTVTPVPDDLLADEPDELWSTVLARKGGWHRVVARMPADPSLN